MLKRFLVQLVIVAALVLAAVLVRGGLTRQEGR